MTHDKLNPQEYLLAGYSRPTKILNVKGKQEDVATYSLTKKMSRPGSAKTAFSLSSHSTHVNRKIRQGDKHIEIDAHKMYDFTSKFMIQHGLDDPVLTQLMKKTDSKSETEQKSSIRFGEDDTEVIHRRYMKTLDDIITVVPSRPTTAYSKRSKSPGLYSNRQSNYETLLETESDSKSYEKRLAIDKNKKKKIPVVIPGTRKGKRLTRAEAKYVVNFLETSPLVSTSNQYVLETKTKPKSLADYKLEVRSRETVWNPSEFSTVKFMAEYIRQREMTTPKKKISIGGMIIHF
jgi:hypothetical protein